ncbi:MAG: TetR/AcrR family transcriptional regulator [Cyclobacteriaceae bacterium]
MEAENTEQKILIAARQVFLKKGLAGARMQEIADMAGINKALLHYYYRSKEQLFRSSFQDLIKQMLPKVFGVFRTDLPFEEKLRTLTADYLDFLTEYPQLPVMILSEIQRDPQLLFNELNIPDLVDFQDLQKQLDEEAEAGRIRPMQVFELIPNLLSLLVFPFAAKPIIQNALKLTDEQFKDFISSRKLTVPDFFMNALKP